MNMFKYAKKISLEKVAILLKRLKTIYEKPHFLNWDNRKDVLRTRSHLLKTLTCENINSFERREPVWKM